MTTGISLARVLQLSSLLLLAAWGTACAVPSQHAEPVVFRVMTYNIHHGRGLDGAVDLQRIAQVILAQQADIVALQEVDKGTQRTGHVDMPAELERLTGMKCVFSNNFAFQGGEYGNAVLSRFPVLDASNHHYAMLREGEQRGLLRLALDVRGRCLTLMNTHIDYRPDDSERLSNVTEIEQRLAPHAAWPAIVCGDFNDTPGSRVHTRLSGFLVDAWPIAGVGYGYTYSSNDPGKRIDYIWHTAQRGLSPRRAWVVPSEASDHLPLVVEFELSGQP